MTIRERLEEVLICVLKEDRIEGNEITEEENIQSAIDTIFGIFGVKE